MRSAIAVVLLFGSATGCVSRTQGVAIGAAGAALTGVVLLASVPDNVNQFGMRVGSGAAQSVGTALMVSGLLTLVAAAAYSETPEAAKPVEIDWGSVFRAEAEQRAQAWQLAKDGFVAARRHECAKVAALSQQVLDLDEALYRSVFLRDVAVGQCISTDAAASPTPPEPGDPDEPPP